MSSQTKILVLHRRVFIYTLLAILAILFLAGICFFTCKNQSSDEIRTAAGFYDTEEADLTAKQNTNCYLPGIYQSCIRLGESQFEISICVDSDHINSITLLAADETISTMYPLLGSTVADLTDKIIETQSLENISYSTEYRYTCLTILSAIRQALDKADDVKTPTA